MVYISSNVQKTLISYEKVQFKSADHLFQVLIGYKGYHISIVCSIVFQTEDGKKGILVSW